MSNVINIEAERMLAPYYDLICRTCQVTKSQVREHIATHTYLEQVLCAKDIINYTIMVDKEQP